MSRAFPVVALLGRPNVGKSTLFNRLIRSNRAITHDRPGITRDRMEGVVRAKDRESFTLIDTGGVMLDGHARVEEGPEGIRGFEAAILEQARQAVEEATLVCLVVDARDGLTPLDRHLAVFLRRQNKPMLLIVNKVDGPDKEALLLAEFHDLGLDLASCSAAHGYNVRELEEEIRDRLFAAEPENPEAPGPELFLEGATRRQKKRLASLGMAAPDAGSEAEAADASKCEAEAPEAYEENTPETNNEPQGLDVEDALTEDIFVGSNPEELPENTEIPEPDGPVRLALLGRPNVGKSSLVNAMAGKNRMIVSDVAGTTRDSVDVEVMINGIPCTFVDTAGVRRPARVVDTVERYSVNSSIKSTTKAHVTLLVLDAGQGVAQQDKRLIDLLHERKTPFMVVVNKCDLIEPGQRKAAEKTFKEALSFCGHVPLLFVSAAQGKNLRRIVPLARKVRTECSLRIGTGRLNKMLEILLGRHQPPLVKGVRAKFFYITQAESEPPTFVFFVNSADRVSPSYARYLEKSLRDLLDIKHAPMRLHFRSSHSKKTK